MTQLSKRISAWLELPAAWGEPSRQMVFGPPYARWWADDLDAVKDALDKVEQAQKQGQYIVGFVSYEAAAAFDQALQTHERGTLPYCYFASYPQPLNALPLPAPLRTDALTPVLVKLPIEEIAYRERVRRALDYIRKGDIYQVNYTVRADVELPLSPLDFFRDRLRAVPMPHAAYLRVDPLQDEPGFALCSLSPELFLRKRGEVLESRPMKGTAARRPSWQEDEAARIELEQSAKNRAENTMIVDLVRNDLGRVCVAGTVEAPLLCEVARHPTVHQMTSLVRGILRPGRSLFEIFKATFPPGSVTGAPKVRAMQIIEELETEPRGIYCGTLGLFFPNGDFELNVAIRTLAARNKEQGTRSKKSTEEINPSSLFLVPATLGLGSGIVADSDPAAEWREVLLKGKFLAVRALPPFELLETFAWTPDEGYRHLDRHLQRLRNSATYFGWTVNIDSLAAGLRAVALTLAQHEQGQRVRVFLRSNGETGIDTKPLELWPDRPLKLFLYEAERVDPEAVLLYHKTTQRGIYDRALAAAQAAGCDEAILVNTRGEITEGSITNIIVKKAGQWWTPALSCGLLPGIYRELELAAGHCREEILTVEDLRNAEEIRVGNSARGRVQAVL